MPMSTGNERVAEALIAGWNWSWNRLFLEDRMTRRAPVRKLLIDLLRSNLGFGVDLFCLLSIDQLEDLRFRVFVGDDKDPRREEYILTSVEDAVDVFLVLRELRQLGYDFEVEGGRAPRLAKGAPRVVRRCAECGHAWLRKLRASRCPHCTSKKVETRRLTARAPRAATSR